uniref:FAS1 domain-containing protein n=2 Tax=Photinus pyralis TaxID=7054 RepID=A0A1Y1L633_PHOPY
MVMVLSVIVATTSTKDALSIMTRRSVVGCLLLFLAGYLLPADANIELPNITAIGKQQILNLEVDNFFAFWDTFKSENGIQITDKPFTILAPSNAAKLHATGTQRENFIKQIILDHVVLGSIVNITNNTKEISFETLRGKTVHVRRKEDKLLANDVLILQSNVGVPNGVIIVLDKYLFSDELSIKKNTSQGKLNVSSHTVVTVKEQPPVQSNTTFIQNVLQVLSYLKSGVRVFQHFLSRSNVSKLLEDGENYTVFVPTDHAFHRWHPIDWGFYPFSVPEFTESVIINHFVKGNYLQDDVKDNQIVTTLGGRQIVFRKIPFLMVNGVQVVKGDTPVANGNIMFTGEVLFVNESVVSRLHQQHRDKETPPLLAFPWFGAQFLSHAFLALERDRRFSHITRFLNLADLAPHVSGTGYTFFVPVDTAFEAIGLDKMPDNYLSNGNGLQVLLNHFVKGRLYDRDLKDGTELLSLGNSTIKIARKKERVDVNDAVIVESEVFVYNLGTMFYIDKVLFSKRDFLPTSTIANDIIPTQRRKVPSIVEKVPDELLEEMGLEPDLLTENDATTSTTVWSTPNVTSSSNATIK